MSKLILSMDGLLLKEIELSKERMTIGRKPHNDIQIDNLAISGEHAAIITILNDSFLEDLSSTNGTFVNGQPIKKHFLQHGDTIELGKYHLSYVNQAMAQAGAPDFERTMILRPGSAPAAPDAPASDASSAPSAHPSAGVASTAPLVLAAIQVISGVNSGKELELTKSLTTLGKPGVQVAVIARRPHGYFITHVEGATFPVVNGVALDAQAHLLSDHDIIEIAGTKMEFFLKA